MGRTTHWHRVRVGLPEGRPDPDWLDTSGAEAGVEDGSTAAVMEVEAELDSTEVASDEVADSSAPAEIATADPVPATSEVEVETELDSLTEDEEESEAEAMMDADSLELVAGEAVVSAVVDEATAVVSTSLAEVEADADSSEALGEGAAVVAAFKALMTKSAPRFCILVFP